MFFSTESSPRIKRFKRLRQIFFLFRLSCLLVMVGVSYQLVKWSHAYDPRFYQFLGTAPGRALSNFMEWPNLHNRIQKEKPFESFSAAEQEMHTYILTRLQQSWPTHTLTFTDGQTKDVRILSAGSGFLNIREYLGTQGRIEKKIQRSALLSIAPYADELPHVGIRDVRFQQKYPEFELSYSGNYTVLSDAPYYQVAESVKTLEDLHAQYVELFAPLIRFPQKEQNLQLLFFSNEEDYREHQEGTAPNLSSSVGFYSPLEDRMVIFNQQFSNRANQVRKDVDEDIQELLLRTNNLSQRKQILEMQERVESTIRERARMETRSTLRHEGAHHLSYTYGVHSWIHTENGWLIEGLASYFEISTPGEVDPVYLKALALLDVTDRIPSLARLVEIRQPEEFETQLPGLEAHEVYALSWSLFHYCMLSEHRENFFAYLQNLQDPDDIGRLMQTPRIHLLAESLGMSEASLQKAWRAHLVAMMSGTI